MPRSAPLVCASLLTLGLVLRALIPAFEAQHGLPPRSRESADSPSDWPKPNAGAEAWQGAAPDLLDRGTLDINSADLHSLQLLPGIGPALARRIADHRKRHGPFRALDELLRVRGVGPATVARLRGVARVDRSHVKDQARVRGSGETAGQPQRLGEKHTRAQVSAKQEGSAP